MPSLPTLFRQVVMKTLDPTSDYAGELPCVSELNDTNKNPFGKIRVCIQSIQNFFCCTTFYVRISTGPYLCQTRQFLLDPNNYLREKARLKDRVF